MSDSSTVISVLALYLAVVISPGPNFALISQTALGRSTRSAWGATLGLAIAATFYAVLAMLGLANLLEHIGWLTNAVRVGGGLYLIYLGAQAWRHAGSSATDHTTAHKTQAAFAAGFRRGLIVNLSNPKAIAFFVSLYAAAIPPATSTTARLAILIASFAIEILWYGFVIVLLSTKPAQQIYQRITTTLDRILGAALIVFGARLATSRT